MTSTWRKHLIICLFLGLLAIPIYFLDLALFEGGGGGNWMLNGAFPVPACRGFRRLRKAAARRGHLQSVNKL